MTDHQVTLITGASAGLGAEMARQLAAKGHDLALCARRVERLDELAAELRDAHGVSVEVAALDVTDTDAVAAVFEGFATSFGRVDRVVVNAGIGKGAPLGTGRPDANLDTARTNFVGALAQTEAAMAIFRRQGAGHLVLISSVAGVRGMRRSATTYAATKAGVSALGEGLRSERVPGVDVSVIHPGYIRTELNAEVENPPFLVELEPGVRALVAAIEARKAVAYVPAWPWRPIAAVLKVAPMALVRKLT